jgi:hypothetical protein
MRAPLPPRSDVLSRDDFAAAAKLARCSEEAARATFQSMRARARRFITKHAPPPTAVAAPTAASALAATPFDDDDDDAPAPAPDATLAALAAAVGAPPLVPVPRPPTPAERDEPLVAELAALRQPDGSVAFPAAAAAAVALMRRAVSVGLRASLADLVHDSRMQLGVPIVFMDEGACVPLAAWMDAALNTHHVTLLRKAMRAAAALPVASAEPVKELARQLHRCRTYVRADDVASEATRILAAWAKVVTPNGGGGSRAAPAIPAMPRMQLPPLPPAPFNGPAISKAATAQLAARAAAPATVAVRSAADRLAGANERVATGARPLSADEILRQRNKKRLMIGSSSGAAPARGGSAAPLPPELAKRLKMVAGSTAPPVNVAAPPPPDEDAMQARVEFAHPPTVAVEVRPRIVFADAMQGLTCVCVQQGLGVLGVGGTGWGCESVEAALQARRESETPAAEYMLAALIPDDPAAPLHVSTEAHAALAAPTPLLPDVPVDFADAAQQAGVLARAGYIAAAQHMGAGWRPHR